MKLNSHRDSSQKTFFPPSLSLSLSLDRGRHSLSAIVQCHVRAFVVDSNGSLSFFFHRTPEFLNFIFIHSFSRTGSLGALNVMQSCVCVCEFGLNNLFCLFADCDIFLLLLFVSSL